MNISLPCDSRKPTGVASGDQFYEFVVHLKLFVECTERLFCNREPDQLLFENPVTVDNSKQISLANNLWKALFAWQILTLVVGHLKVAGLVQNH
jgi:hypothetical protein